MKYSTTPPWLCVACAAAFAAAMVPANADYPSKVLSQGPTLYWRLNEKPTVPGGDRAINAGSLGAEANGFYVGTASHPTPGALVGNPSNSGAAFDATASSIVSIPHSAALNPKAAFSVEFWANPNADTTTAAPTCVVSSGQFASPRSGWLIYQIDTGWSFRMYNQNGTTPAINISGGAPAVVGTWAHVMATYDGTNAVLYVNGVLAVSGAVPSYVPSAGAPMYIGGRADNSFWWNGMADEVAVYDKALTAADADKHYKNGIAASPSPAYSALVQSSVPIAYYRLDEPAYTAPTTLPVAKNLGTLGAAGDASYNPGVNGQADGPRPPIYGGFESDNSGGGFNGNAGYVGSNANLNDLAKFTLMGWIRRGANHSGRGGYFGQNDLLEFGDADSGANIEAWINAYGANIKFPYPFSDNAWGQFAIVGDGATVTVFTNGVAAASTAKAVDTYGTSAFNLNIGGGGVFNASGDNFLGNIDEVAVFDKALTAQQILDIYYSANIAPIIGTQPAAPARDIFEGNTIALTVAATGTPTLKYQWRKGGSNLAGKTAADLTIASATVGDSGTYDVIVSNDFGSVTSSNVTVTVKPADTIAPTLKYASGTSSFTGVRVWFSEPLDQATAEKASNYTLTGGLTVTSAKLSAPPGTAGDSIVDLVTSVQTAGTTYTLTVSGVKDQSAPGNSVATGSTVQFSSWTLAQGYLTFEHYDNIPGAADTDIDKGLADPRVIAGNPTTAGFIKGKFDTRTVFPDDSHENFLARMTGYITPTESGDYYFFLGSDDAGRLYLSTSEKIPNPATDTPICIETGCCHGFAEPGDSPTTTDTAITLQAGKRYGVLALLKEAGGGDHLEVAWRKASDSTAAASLPRLPGQFLSTYVDPNVEVQFKTQPANQPGVLPTPVIVFGTVDFKSGAGGFSVTNSDKVPPGPFEYDAATGAWVANGGESACTGPYNSSLMSPAYTVPQTEEVSLTFSHRYSFESDYWDGGGVRISVNGGAFTPVNPDNFTANGYAAKNIQGTGILKDQRAFNADSPGYAAGTFITSSVILGSFTKNDTIVVEFAGAWDDCSTASTPGWVIKTFELAYGKAARASTFTAEATAMKQGQPVSFTYQWQRNDGSSWVDIADATTSSYRFFPAAADMTASFRVVAGVPGRALESNTVKLTADSGTPPEVSVARSATGASITFTGKLQSSATVKGSYSDVAGATSPYPVPAGSSVVFYRSVK